MANIIRGSEATSVELAGDKDKQRQLANAVKKSVKLSFAEQRAECEKTGRPFRPSAQEIRRRTMLAYEWFAYMRGDLYFSVRKSCALLPEALRHQIQGVPWTPPKGGFNPKLTRFD